MICHVTISYQFLRFYIIHGANIKNVFEICKFYLKKLDICFAHLGALVKFV